MKLRYYEIKKLGILIFYIFIFNFSFLIFNLPKAHAQSFNLSVLPPLVQTTIKPGKTITQVYKITNQGISNTVSVSLVPFTPADELGNIRLHPATSIRQPASGNQILETGNGQLAANSFLSWFSLSTIKLPGSFKIQSAETKEITLKIKVPKNAEIKDYYASLIFKAVPDTPMQGTSGSQAAGGVATNILLTVSQSNNIPKLGKIEEFNVRKQPAASRQPPEAGNWMLDAGNWQLPFFDSSDTIPFKLRLENSGPNLFLASGTIKISGGLNRTNDLLEIPSQNVLSNSTRVLFMKNTDEQPLKEIVWQPKGFKIGKFSAQAVLNLDNGSDKLEANTYFWIIPWKMGVGVLVGLIVLVIIKIVLK